MSRALVAAALISLSLLSPEAATAAAGPGMPVETCEHVVVTNPFSDSQGGVLGGAVVPVADGADLRSGRVTCTVRDGFSHVDPAVVAVSSGTMAGVAVAPYETVEYVEPVGHYFTACLSVEIDGAGTFYWDDEAGAWSTDPGVLCFDLCCAGDDDDLVDTALGVYDEVNEYVIAYVDPPLCAVLGGDVAVAGEPVWDCPPYES